mgnify:CR=1 FL=1
MLFIPNIVRAASANVSISAPGSVYVGDTVNVSVTVSSGSSLGNWNFNVNYDEELLEYISTTADTSQSAFGEANGSGQTSVTYNWSFKAIGSGSASFNVSSISVISWDDFSEMGEHCSASTSINVVRPSSGGSNGGSGGSNIGDDQPDYNYEYSDDNSLSYLNVEGFDISFDPSITEYSVSVPNDTKKVSVGATANDGKASVSGIGDYEVSEGSNKIEVLVTAENGDTRTYTIDVVVKEETPIEVSVGDEKFTVVRKADKLPKANATYSSSTILIKGESIPCYHSDITDIYLVGLMNEKGKIKLYRYLASNDKFLKYTEVSIGGLYLILTDTNETPVGYSAGKVTIDGKEYDAFLKDDAYPLLHGINLENGNEGFYSYDDNDKTVQMFKGIATSAKGINNYVFYGLIGLCIFEFIMLIFSVVSKNKKLKSLLHDKLDTKTEFEKMADVTYNDEDNITDDLTDQYMSDSEQDDNGSVDSELDGEVSENSDASLDESLENDSSSENIDDNSSYEDEESKVENTDSDNSNDDVFDELSSSNETDEWESDSKNYKEFSEDTLGHTALISRSVSNVYNNSVNRKEDIKKRKASRKKKRFGKNDDDDMFKF